MRIASFVSGSLLVAIFFLTFLMSPPITSAEAVIQIQAGEGLRDIAASLHDGGVVRSRVAFMLYAFFSGSAHKLKPGHYVFSEGVAVPYAVSLLTKGPEDVEVLITEGDSLKDIEAKLVAANIVAPGALTSLSVKVFKDDYPFLGKANSLEGFLFPDTYRFALGSTGERVLKKMLDNFKAKVSFFPADVTSGKFYKDLILASLIEREVPGAEDRRMVSGILRRRLAIGMPLQVDATVIYVKCEGKYIDCPPLTRSDFGIKSLTNTYLVQGLPPEPIANPGLDSIEAARTPRTSPYLYYLSDPKTGKTVFAETLDEHNANRAKYLLR